MNPVPPTAQEIRDEEHLRLLSIFHFVLGGMEIFFALIPVIHLAVGTGMVVFGATEPHRQDTAPLMLIGSFFIIFATVFIVAGLTLGGFTLYSGFCLRRREKRFLSLVVAAVNCVWVPLGTLLGVFTLIVLLRDSVRRLYPA